MSLRMSCFTSWLLHKTVSVPGMLFSVAHCFTTSTSGTTIATTQLWKENIFVKFSASERKYFQTNLQTLAMNEDLFDELRLNVNIFNLFRHDVLALA